MTLIMVSNCYRSSNADCERLIRALERYSQICDPDVPSAPREDVNCISDDELRARGAFNSISECADFIESRMPGCDKYSLEEIREYRIEQIDGLSSFHEGVSPFPEGCSCQIPVGELRFACTDAIRFSKE